MLGEKLIIGKDFKKVADRLGDLFLPQIKKSSGKFFIAVAGESGSGKTCISFALSKVLSEKGIKTAIIQHDDYYYHPPKETTLKRKEDMANVGLSEVQLALLEQNLQEIRKGKKEIEKPLVVFDKNQIISEIVSLEGINVVIVEGTYTFVLENVDQHVFIDRTYQETKESRGARGREEQDEFIERVLKIEHEIVTLGKPKADVLVTKDFEVEEKRTR